MKYKIFKLHFKTGVRSGVGSLESNSVDILADVIFSALVNEASSMENGTLDTLLYGFKNRDLKLSDAFPFIGEEYFMPKPLKIFSKKTGEDSGNSTEKKLFKKITHIPLSHWNEYLKEKSDPREIKELTDQIGSSGIDTRIKTGEKNELYRLKYFRFDESSGLYFILGYTEEKYLSLIQEVLKSLSFSGIGGKKSSGLGKFTFEMSELPEELEGKIDTEKSQMLLTTSMAAEKEIDSVSGNYLLVRRGGFIYSESSSMPTFRKRTMHFFKSGSIFRDRFDGEIFRVDKGFSHPVYRYSVPMWLEVL